MCRRRRRETEADDETEHDLAHRQRYDGQGQPDERQAKVRGEAVFLAPAPRARLSSLLGVHAYVRVRVMCPSAVPPADITGTQLSLCTHLYSFAPIYRAPPACRLQATGHTRLSTPAHTAQSIAHPQYAPALVHARCASACIFSRVHCCFDFAELSSADGHVARRIA
eukprot:scaffold11316_cov112-Isochrysis_galbana.AAC.4